MASLTIHDLDDRLMRLLRLRAEANACSMSEEASRILRDALTGARPRSLADLATAIFGRDNGIELEPHPAMPPPAPIFDEE